MPKAFLLRFQEPCLEEAAIDCIRRSETATKIAKEGARDQASDGMYALASSQRKTITRQEREGTDRSDDTYGLPGTAVPLAARGTRTATFVEAESSDDDTEDAYTSKAVPRWIKSEKISKKTVTEVEAEGSDYNDDRQTTLHVIRPCS